MQRLIKTLWRESGTTIVFVTHNTREAVCLATRDHRSSEAAVKGRRWNVWVVHRAGPGCSGAGFRFRREATIAGTGARSGIGERAQNALSFTINQSCPFTNATPPVIGSIQRPLPDFSETGRDAGAQGRDGHSGPPMAARKSAAAKSSAWSASIPSKTKPRSVASSAASCRIGPASIRF